MLEMNMRERRRYLLDMKTNLELLELDIRQEENHWRTIRLVDFAAIHAFAYGGGVDAEKADSSIELLDSHRFARQHVALGLIFSAQFAPLGLLPSYSSELANHLRRIKSDSTLIQHLLGRGKERRGRLRGLLENQSEFQQFQEKHRKGNAGVEDAIALAQRSFPEILAMVRVASGDVLGTLARLLRDEMIADAKTLLPGEAITNPPQLLIDDWYEEILQSRSNDRQYASMIDAIACASLEAAQPVFSDARVNIQFITPSTILARLMKERLSANFQSPVRGYDYFLLSMAFDGRRDKIPQIKQEVDELYRVYENVTHPAEADKWLDGAEGIWKEVENLSALQDSGLSEKLLQIKQSGKFEQIIYRLAVAASEHPGAFDEQAMIVASDFQRELQLFRNLLPEQKAAESIRGFLAVYQRRKDWLALPSLDDDLPLALRFKADSIHAYVEHLSSLPDARSRHAWKAAAANVSLKVIEEAHEEKYLFAAYLAALAGRDNGAFMMLNVGLDTAVNDLKVEFFYLRAVISRHRYEYREARAALNAAQSISPKDPRLLLEVAAIEWLHARSEVTLGSEEYRNGIRNAITQAEDASPEGKRMNRTLTRVLQVRSGNTLAFLYAELALVSSEVEWPRLLEQAEKHLGSLEGVWADAEWPGRALDTRAWIKYSRAKLLRPQNRLDLLAAARSDIERALLSEGLEQRRRLLLSHLEAVDSETHSA